ncbi:hypothetical protein BJ138DRAFT_618299 [Hygrophoropsis aurantiaca]|uniref:Uncharacterized protein n=1 Tax=Hygrophoropsis aurantiaca TaxID=72124 RepID=A0ACB8A1L3_9AGAM|nr:hypothetical protein BJ138DRAFT_618299 [Hygrophoropsis aurantiaca]
MVNHAFNWFYAPIFHIFLHFSHLQRATFDHQCSVKNTPLNRGQSSQSGLELLSQRPLIRHLQSSCPTGPGNIIVLLFDRPFLFKVVPSMIILAFLVRGFEFINLSTIMMSRYTDGIKFLFDTNNSEATRVFFCSNVPSHRCFQLHHSNDPRTTYVLSG